MPAHYRRAFLASATAAGRLLRRYGTRTVVAVALALCAGSLVGLAAGGDPSPAVVLAWLMTWGLSGGTIYVALTREGIGDAAAEDRGAASALFESTTHVGGALAVAAYPTLLGAGVGYPAVQLLGAALAGSGIITTLVIMPRRPRA